jgi:hypothetical protein
VLETSVEEERLSKGHDIRSEASREDTGSSGIRIKEKKVRSPYIVRCVVTLNEDGA